MRRATGWILLLALVSLAAAAVASADQVRVQSTTDTSDAGLIDPTTNTGPLADEYAKQQPGDTIKYTAVGTGAALQNAQNGLADVVITHAPSLEAAFVQQGYSLGLGRQIFFSDYVIVGPKTDPAGVLTKHPHDAIGALEDIAAAGDANQATFESRGGQSAPSGTNVQEQIMWGLTNTVTKQHAANAGSDNTRFEPGSGGTYPTWYKKNNTGQAANLQLTSACTGAVGCYTMVDRGTYNRNVNNGTVTNLEIVSQINDTAARGGKNLLVNPFSVYIVNPDAINTSPKPNVPAAKRFVNFLVSPAFQTFLTGFPTTVDPAFHPDAAPSVSLDSATPTTVDPGSTVTFAGTVVNLLPGGGPDVGQPVQLEQSTDGGTTWIDNAVGTQTDSSGHFSTATVVAKKTQYRLKLDDHAATTYNQFTATTDDLGVIDVNAAAEPTATPTATATATATATPKPDTTAPKVTKVKLARKSVSIHVSEGSKITVTITRKGKTVATVKAKTGGAKTITIKHKALGRGKYRLRIVVTDSSGNKRTVKKSVTRK